MAATSPDPNEPTLTHDVRDVPSSENENIVRYFGDYELLAEIARGGMGIVYKARQVNLNRIVALKMILAGQLANDSDVKRFYSEAEAAAKLDHPGIVPIFEIGQHEGQHYFSMAFIEGESLAKKVATGALPPREAAELVRKVAEAVEYAHQKGIIHRDLKPANVLVDQTGQPRVTDFGLAKQLHGDSGLTGTGQILGTPGYMPPEQAAGKVDQVGPQSDVYALGAVLYCLLTGRPPFQAGSPVETLVQVMSQEPVPIRELNPQVPRELEAIALKCLEKEPSRRYGSAQELSLELNRYLNGEPILVRPAKARERLWKWARRKPIRAGLLAAAVVLVVWTIVHLNSDNSIPSPDDQNPHVTKETYVKITPLMTSWELNDLLGSGKVVEERGLIIDAAGHFKRYSSGGGGYNEEFGTISGHDGKPSQTIQKVGVWRNGKRAIFVTLENDKVISKREQGLFQ